MSIEVKVPSMGESITEAYIGRWYKKVGEPVDEDENLVELESEKATFDIPAPAAGVIEKILKKYGETARVGEVIGYIDDAQGSKKAAKGKGKDDRDEPSPKKADKRGSRPQEDDSEKQSSGSSRVMPAARRALEEHGLTEDEVKASGPGGRLLKEDVLRHVAGGHDVDVATENDDTQDGYREEEVVPMSPIRRRIAERLVRAQQTAALLTTFNEIDMSSVMELRKKHRDAFRAKYGAKLGFMSFFVKAVIEALKEVPQVNAEIRGNDIVYRNYYDIGIAVGGGKGLVVPVLRNADGMSYAEIEQAIEDLSQRAKDNKLDIHELEGGTFTISNGGIYGSLLSTPIVNPPQSGVLGMHAIQERPVAREGAVVVRPMMYVALTYDHRLVDGREAVTFLRRIKETVEEPARILIEV